MRTSAILVLIVYVWIVIYTLYLLFTGYIILGLIGVVFCILNRSIPKEMINDLKR